MLLCQQTTQNTLKLSPGHNWANINLQNDRHYARNRTTKWSIARCCLLCTRPL